MSLMGIDVGTTGCKAMVFSFTGDVLAEARKDYRLVTNRDRHCVLNPEEVWQAVGNCVRQCNAAAAKDPVKAFAVSAQGEAVIPVDKRGEALSDAPVSADCRGEEFLEVVERELGSDWIYQTTGQIMDPIHTLFKLLWWKKYCPDLYENTWKFLPFDSFVLFRMGLPPVMEHTLAARTMCYDNAGRRWSERIHRVFGLAEEKMPEVEASGRSVGALQPAVCGDLGFPADAKAVMGGHDQLCGALGAGVSDEGVAYSIGTTECLTFVAEGQVRDLKPRYPEYPFVIPNRRATLAGSQAGARLFTWLQQNFFRDAGPNYVFEIEQSMDSRYATDVVFLGHLTGTGLHYNNSKARGIIHGLTLDTALEDILKAAHEGITFEQYLSFKSLSGERGKFDKIIAVGGGAKSRTWMQIKADIFRTPIIAAKVADASVLGAAVLAGLGTGIFSDAQSAVRELVELGDTYLPQRDMEPYYEKKIRSYNALYERNNE